MGRKINILITGGSGFIGRNLSELLKIKYNILKPTHNELDLLDSASVTNYFKKNLVDTVVHCAVMGGSRKSEFVEGSFQNNIRMFINLLRNKKYFKKIINLGSGAEYDRAFSIESVSEKDFDNNVPSDSYGFYKYICSKYIENEKDIVCLRIFGMYGKYENPELRFISNAICKNLLGLPITLKQNALFDYVYIKDFVKIVEYFISNQVKEKFYNIGRGEKIDLITIAEKINLISGKKVNITIAMAGLNKEYTCDSSRLRQELKKFIFTDFDISLKELMQWYSEIPLNKTLFLKDKA